MDCPRRGRRWPGWRACRGRRFRSLCWARWRVPTRRWWRRLWRRCGRTIQTQRSSCRRAICARRGLVSPGLVARRLNCSTRSTISAYPGSRLSGARWQRSAGRAREHRRHGYSRRGLRRARPPRLRSSGRWRIRAIGLSMRSTAVSARRCARSTALARRSAPVAVSLSGRAGRCGRYNVTFDFLMPRAISIDIDHRGSPLKDTPQVAAQRTT